MRLDPTVMPTMNGQDFRVLESVEKAMHQHSLVPAPLIASLANLRHGGTGKILSSLLRDKLLSHDKSCGYDGYRLTNAGYDILALHNLKTRKLIAAFGDRIGTGKESDVYLAVRPSGEQVVLKFHRLGRTSFRNVKKTRDYFVYHGKKGMNTEPSNQGNSWLFLSRKSALKEFAFMKALYDVDYPTPKPLGHNRHIVVMSLVRGVPLYQIRPQNLSPEQAASIFSQAADLAVRLAQHGLVHCDLNEFNLLVDMSGIQQSAMSQEHDPYVRHSGMSVVAESNPGMLSARGPWEPEHLQEVELDAGSHGDNEPPTPLELLENGEPRPIVTLIDFPQMVSTQHPNAKELYERDTSCLFKFFSHKLQFNIPEPERQKLHLTWESIQDILKEHQHLDAEIQGDDGLSVCLASKAQLRLDQELQASGYSNEDSSRDMELYYYFNTDQPTDGQLQEDNTFQGEIEHILEDVEATNETTNDREEVAERSIGESGISTVASQQRSVAIQCSELLTDMNRQQLQEQARLRVKQQLDSQKRKIRSRGAFHKHNSNKTYVKGKRVFEDIGIQ